MIKWTRMNQCLQILLLLTDAELFSEDHDGVVGQWTAKVQICLCCVYTQSGQSLRCNDKQRRSGPVFDEKLYDDLRRTRDVRNELLISIWRLQISS